MRQCTPNIRTPFCGKGDCVWPLKKAEPIDWSVRHEPAVWPGNDPGLGQPVRPFADTFSAEMVIMEHFFPAKASSPIKPLTSYVTDPDGVLHEVGDDLTPLGDSRRPSVAVCKGDWSLGAACGTCDRCQQSALRGPVKLQGGVRELSVQLLRPSEMDALWNWHADEEHRCAGRGEYDDAKWHKERAEAFRREPAKGKAA